MEYDAFNPYDCTLYGGVGGNSVEMHTRFTVSSTSSYLDVCVGGGGGGSHYAWTEGYLSTSSTGQIRAYGGVGGVGDGAGLIIIYTAIRRW